MKKIKLILHIGNKCPVHPGDYVIYRTICEGYISQLHIPQKASLINWKTPVLGRIYGYQVVRLTKLGVSTLYNKVYNDISKQ